MKEGYAAPPKAIRSQCQMERGDSTMLCCCTVVGRTQGKVTNRVHNETPQSCHDWYMIRYRSNITNELFLKVHVFIQSSDIRKIDEHFCARSRKDITRKKPAQFVFSMYHHRFLLLLKILHTCAVIHVSFSSLDNACVADKAQREYMFVWDWCTCGNEKKSFLVFVYFNASCVTLRIVARCPNSCW